MPSSSSSGFQRQGRRGISGRNSVLTMTQPGGNKQAEAQSNLILVQDGIEENPINEPANEIDYTALDGKPNASELTKDVIESRPQRRLHEVITMAIYFSLSLLTVIIALPWDVEFGD